MASCQRRIFRVVVSSAAFRGVRPEMEDRCGRFQLPDGTVVAYVADGHGGSTTADVIADNLPPLARAYCRSVPVKQEEVVQLFGMLDDIACARTTAAGHHDGSTLTVAFIHPDGRVVVGNSGDSKALLVGRRDGEVRWETEMHDAFDEAERDRVEREHGAFVFKGRLLGMLSVTRAVGDLDFKAYGLSCRPVVWTLPELHADAILLLVTDGMWAGLSRSDFLRRTAVAVKEGAREGKLRQVTEGLLQAATGLDNTTAVAVFGRRVGEDTATRAR